MSLSVELYFQTPLPAPPPQRSVHPAGALLLPQVPGAHLRPLHRRAGRGGGGGAAGGQDGGDPSLILWVWLGQDIPARYEAVSA